MVQRDKWSRHRSAATFCSVFLKQWDQRVRSERMFLIVLEVSWSTCLNTIAFLASQIFQRMIRQTEFQMIGGSACGKFVSQMSVNGKHFRSMPIVRQTCAAAGHRKKRCCMSSSSWEHLGQGAASRMFLCLRLYFFESCIALSKIILIYVQVKEIEIRKMLRPVLIWQYTIGYSSVKWTFLNLVKILYIIHKIQQHKIRICLVSITKTKVDPRNQL
jgi:hypothetical protein